MVRKVILTNKGDIEIIIEGKVQFSGTLEQLAPLEEGDALKEFIRMLKQIIKKAEEIQRWRT